MKLRIFIEKPRPVYVLGWILGLLLIPPLLDGCGSNKNRGIEATVAYDTTDTGVGDGPSDYPDAFITPSAIKIGLKSVKLIKSGEIDPSYTIFDTGSDTNPFVLDLNTTPQRIEINNAFPSGCQCDYNKVQIEVTFFDIQATFYKNSSPVDHRIRFYTLDLTDPDLGKPVQAGDVLIGDLVPHFNWVDTADGTFVPLSGTRPTVPLQVPYTVFPNNSYSPTVTIDLPSLLTIPDKPKGTFTVTLTVHAGNMFFYDNTDNNGQFDLDTDGRLNFNDPDSHYYPVFPTIDATGQ